MSFFQLAYLSLALFVVLRFLLPLPWSGWTKLLLAVLILSISLHHTWTRLLWGSMFSPEIPRPAVMAVNWVFTATLLLACCQLVIDFVGGIVAILRRRRIAIPVMLRYVVGSLAVLLAAYGVVQAARVPPVKTIEISVIGLPAQFDGYRIAHLTDLHISRLFEAPWVSKVVDATNEQKPDLVLITGDLSDGTLERRRLDVEPLRALSAPDGVYLSPGNHEYYFGYAGWSARIEELGISVLANSHRVLERNGGQLVIAGMTDVGAAATNGFPGPDLGQARRGAPADAPVILLDHQPRNATKAAEAGVALQLSGHTHGGLVIGWDRLIARANGGFVSGLYDVGAMKLYVSNGTGLWPGFAIRLGRDSELTVITLRSTEQDSQH